jgi:hypothetical protein
VVVMVEPFCSTSACLLVDSILMMSCLIDNVDA